ncbi:hypothetical protein TELCIR_04963, partial [Teladorsagia circumcincta]
MNSSATELVDQATATRDRQIAAAVIFMIAFPGVIFNTLVAMFTRRLPTLNNPFGRLTASQATGEIVFCACFAFHYVPMVALNIEVMKEFSHYVGLISLMCYDICGQLWYVDFTQDMIVVFIIAIIDTITIIKYKLSISKMSKLNNHVAKRNLDKTLLKQ